MPDKVKLPKEVGSLLEDLINQGDRTIYGILSHLTMNCNQRTVEARKILEALEDPWSLIMQALVNGYEIEETREDKVREIFKVPSDYNDESNEFNTPYRNGILDTLNALNIIIEGINA